MHLLLYLPLQLRRHKDQSPDGPLRRCNGPLPRSVSPHIGYRDRRREAALVLITMNQFLPQNAVQYVQLYSQLTVRPPAVVDTVLGRIVEKERVVRIVLLPDLQPLQ